jgi:hypothetical protein
MAIIKQAKNITITVTEDYLLMVGGRLKKTAGKINIESKKENLVMSSNKKIMTVGNQQQ